ncbi:MAG: phosphotransferase [Gammaproteobacteria bacterium]|nr:phosphotransferase [Gammaproteobacteria bacterium]
MTKDQRKVQINKWALQQLAARSIVMSADEPLVPASDDASFRRYYRFQNGPHQFVFVDAPPEKEDSRPFVAISKYLTDTGLNAPVVYAADFDLGFMMISDLGVNLYLSAIEADKKCGTNEAHSLYKDALDALCTMQSIRSDVPDYDQRLLQMEMDLFPDWFLAKELNLKISSDERRLLDSVFQLMVENALQQPQVFVHRDYHSRNLMVTDENNPGILDFQDAVQGAVTYDLVSLLRDCYYKLPPDEIRNWVAYFRSLLVEKRRIESVDKDRFMRWFDLMGLQRHLKCSGIFSRLHLRDGKPGYLGDIPLIIGYMKEVCADYDDLHSFGNWLSETIEPRMNSELFKR